MKQKKLNKNQKAVLQLMKNADQTAKQLMSVLADLDNLFDALNMQEQEQLKEHFDCQEWYRTYAELDENIKEY